MAQYTCEVCGKVHDELPMAIAYRRPAEYFAVPAEEHDKRVFFSPDVCVIDDEQFIIRGVLKLPILNSDKTFDWGTWAIIDKADFLRYYELWDSPDAEAEPPFLGKLSGGIRGYPDSDLLPVTVHLQSGGMRPLFKVVSEEHPLGIDQRRGVPLRYVHDLFVDVEQAKHERKADSGLKGWVSKMKKRRAEP